MLSILPVDAGVIRCICNYDHDDNFTIQCERCNAWQHAGCVNIANEASVPENYLCPDCTGDVTPIAREEARERQRLMLKQRAQLAKLGIAHRPGEHEEPKRRGRKRRSESEPQEVVEQIIVTNPEAYYVPAQKMIWSPAADEWRQANNSAIKDLPTAPRETKPIQLQVIRRLRDTKRYNMGIDTLTIVTPSSVSANRFVCDVTGEVLLRTEYAKSPHNQHAKLGCPKPGTVFVPGLPLVIDSRRRGSPVLFLRRGSRPNVRLVPCRTSKGELRVLLYTRTALHPGDELLLGWHWPASHPMRTSPDSPVLQQMFWLLGLPRSECLPSVADENDEDWEIREAFVAPARPASQAQILREEFAKRARRDEDVAEPPEAASLHVWVSPPQEPVVQKKKKLSLADYIKKRA